MKKIHYILIILAGLIVIANFFIQCHGGDSIETEISKSELGRLIFFDSNFSNPVGQSCASCHSPAFAFSDPMHRIVPEGAKKGLFTNRNAPALTYSMFTPEFYFDKGKQTYIGGLFLDGRAKTLEQQAKQPFLNPLEMNNISKKMVIAKLKMAPYYDEFVKIYGNISDFEKVFKNIGEALAEFEKSKELNQFNSKFDYYMLGKISLTERELRGLNLFKDTTKSKCANCHIIEPNSKGKILFTDYTYDNIGLPINPENPHYHIPASYNPKPIDFGLGAILKNKEFDGHFKVPSLRNVAVTAPYFHNGIFNTLEEAVHFYNKKNRLQSKVEIPETVNHEELDNVSLTPLEEKDIVAFLKTLTDGYKMNVNERE